MIMSIRYTKIIYYCIATIYREKGQINYGKTNFISSNTVLQ